MKHIEKVALVASCLFALAASQVGCSSSEGDGKGGKTPHGPVDDKKNPVNPEAAKLYAEGLAEMERLDKMPNGWTADTCAATAKKFLDAADAQGKFFAGAIYNAGASYHRCNDFANARKYYKQVLDKDEKFHRARVQLARFDLADSGDTAIDKAMSEYQRAITDSDFQNVEALVELARLQMKRNNNASDSDGANDFERAKKNLQRALAVDDGYMPAFNLLALYYLIARSRTPASRSRRARAARRSRRRARSIRRRSISRCSSRRRASARTRTTRRSTTPPGSSSSRPAISTTPCAASEPRDSSIRTSSRRT